jgi:hypothetical protein
LLLIITFNADFNFGMRLNMISNQILIYENSKNYFYCVANVLFFYRLYNFKIDGDQLTGTAKTPKGDMPINDGKLSGSSFTFNVVVNNMEIDHSGKFYGDSVGVDISLGDIKSHATLLRK